MGAEVPLREDLAASAEVLGLVATQALATASMPGQDMPAAMVVGPESASLEASVVVTVASVEDLTAWWEVKASPLARWVASGK